MLHCSSKQIITFPYIVQLGDTDLGISCVENRIKWANCRPEIYDGLSVASPI